jgi:hypothetical protein
LKEPKGLSFAVPDLLMIQAWSDFHDLVMRIDLDTVADDDHYDEIISLSPSRGNLRRWMVWRSRDGIVVQPMMGRPMLFDAMADALDVLIPVQE